MQYNTALTHCAETPVSKVRVYYAFSSPSPQRRDNPDRSKIISLHGALNVDTATQIDKEAMLKLRYYNERTQYFNTTHLEKVHAKHKNTNINRELFGPKPTHLIQTPIHSIVETIQGVAQS